MKLLPAYIRRGRLEEKVVLGAVGKDTLEAYLKLSSACAVFKVAMRCISRVSADLNI